MMSSGLRSKVALGTANFGMAYGIRNKAGAAVSAAMVTALIGAAHRLGVDTVDTAAAYGDAESVLGAALTSSSPLRIVTKLPAGRTDAIAACEESLQRLGVSQLEAYLLHDAGAALHRRELWDAMLQVKERGLARRIGLSVYRPKEVDDAIVAGIVPDIVQVPMNVLDQRFAREAKRYAALGVAIHARSVFLQGVLLSPPTQLPAPLRALAPALDRFESLARDAGVSRVELAVAAVASIPGVERLVIGVESTSELEEAVSASAAPRRIPALARIEELACEDEDLILPVNWNRTRVAR